MSPKPQSSSLKDIFISYAHEDVGFVAQLVSALEAEGWTVWWDRYMMQAGDEFSQRIERALAEARCVIVVWSRNSVGSRWVKEEALVGLDREILVPILLNSVMPPFGFRLISGVRFADWAEQASQASARELFRAVERLVERRAPLQTVKGSRELTPSQVVIALGALALFIGIVISASRDQGAGKNVSPPAPPPPVAQVDQSLNDSTGVMAGVDAKVRPAAPDDLVSMTSESMGEEMAATADSVSGEATTLESETLDADAPPVGTGQIVVIARPSPSLAWKDIAFAIDDRPFGYEGIIDAHAVEVVRLNVAAGEHSLRVNPELNEEPILFNVAPNETVDIEFYRRSYSRFDWKVYIRGDRAR